MKKHKLSADSLSSRQYWKPTLEAFNQKLSQLEKCGILKRKALIQILNHLAEVLIDSEPSVMKQIKKSRKDIKQSRVSVAGNNFQALVAYALRENVAVGNLPQLKIVLKPKQHPLVEKYAIIMVNGESQKPDMDILNLL